MIGMQVQTANLSSFPPTCLYRIDSVRVEAALKIAFEINNFLKISCKTFRLIVFWISKSTLFFFYLSNKIELKFT